MSLEKCGRTVLEIVSPAVDFETIKNGINLVDIEQLNAHLNKLSIESFDFRLSTWTKYKMDF